MLNNGQPSAAARPSGKLTPFGRSSAPSAHRLDDEAMRSAPVGLATLAKNARPAGGAPGGR